MKFVDQLPNGFYGHSTGGDHGPLRHYDPEKINSLRMRVNPDVDAWDTSEVRESMKRFGEVATLVNCEDYTTGEMVGGALIRFDHREAYKKRALLDASDIVVADGYRRQLIGSYLFSYGMTAQRLVGDAMAFPTEVGITDRNRVLGPVAGVALAKAGFVRHDQEGNPRMLLAGTGLLRSVDNAHAYGGLMGRMPLGWNGFMRAGAKFMDRPEGVHVFRDGAYVGAVLDTGSRLEIDEHERFFGHRDYVDCSGRVFAQLVRQPEDDFFFASDLVNRLRSAF